jgi:hypothetical protein
MEDDDSAAPRGMPLFMDDTDPVVDDPSADTHRSFWFPANRAAVKLVACLESLRDIQRVLEVMNTQGEPLPDRRLMKILATPLHSLTTSVHAIHNELYGNAKEYPHLEPSDKQVLAVRRARFLQSVHEDQSNLRLVRDKISAHVDHDVFDGDPRRIWKFVELERLLTHLQAILGELRFLLELDTYAWTRESGADGIFRVMNVDGVQVDIDLRQPAIVGVTLVVSPKHYLAEVLHRVARTAERLKDRDRSRGGVG